MSAVIQQNSVDLRTLPVLAKRQLKTVDYPENYKKACAALLECSRIDQCKDIADKHEAIAKYAKQAKDGRLSDYAQRIHLRAVTRLGDLLNEIQDPSDRVRAANKAGLSKQARYKSIHIAGSIPRDELNEAIEATPPASKSELNQIARRYREGKLRSWQSTCLDYRRAIGCVGGISQQTDNLEKYIPHLTQDEGGKVHESLVRAAEKIDQLLRILEPKEGAVQ